MLYSAITLIIGYRFIFSTVAVNFDVGDQHDLSVLTYNTRVFNVYDHLNEEYQSSKKMIDWAVNDESDIKCFQEYYNKNSSEIFNTTKLLQRKGTYYAYAQPNLVSHKQEFGLAIFSKHPIINKGRIKFKEKSKNDAIFADILFKKDTIRVINIHLQSMSIGEGVFDSTQTWQTNVKNLGRKLKRGFIARAQQLDAIEAYIEKCPYPIILCGDLNDPPYSYTYFKLQCMLSSTFEDAANGFGFSYNGKLFFLRIDNQFYSPELQATDCFTLRDIDYSDHFPVKAYYKIK